VMIWVSTTNAVSAGEDAGILLIFVRPRPNGKLRSSTGAFSRLEVLNPGVCDFRAQPLTPMILRTYKIQCPSQTAVPSRRKK
jgi:hypothetical protein